MKISMDKQYRTKCGYKVRIYAVDGGGKYPVHGACFFDGEWILCRWAADGSCWGDPDLYLIEVKPRIQREYWHNVYPNASDVNIQKTREDADLWAANDRIACVKIIIDCQEGDGL